VEKNKKVYPWADYLKSIILHPDPCWVINSLNDFWTVMWHMPHTDLIIVYVFSEEELARAYLQELKWGNCVVRRFRWSELCKKFPNLLAAIDYSSERDLCKLTLLKPR